VTTYLIEKVTKFSKVKSGSSLPELIAADSPTLDLPAFKSHLETLRSAYTESIGLLDESDFYQIYDLMTIQFESELEGFLESDLDMKELQAFYRMKTKLLQSRIQELNKLVQGNYADI